MTRTFNELYRQELEGLISSETQLSRLLPRLARATHTGELREALLSGAQSCREQLKALRGLAKKFGKEPAHVPGAGFRALLDDCLELTRRLPTGNLRDTALIAYLQRAEHYRMAAYASVHDFARLLGEDDAAEILQTFGRAVTGTSRNLGAIAIQVNAESYVDTRIEAH